MIIYESWDIYWSCKWRRFIIRTYIRTFAFVFRIRYPFRSHNNYSVEYVGDQNDVKKSIAPSQRGIFSRHMEIRACLVQYCVKMVSSIAVVGAIMLVGRHESRLSYALGMLAVIAATSNIVGGFLITDRMLKMFKSSRPTSPTKP